MKIKESEWMDDLPDSEEESKIDEAMLGMGDFVAQMSDVEGYLYDEEQAVAMQLEEVELSMPIQLDLNKGENDTVVFGASPPLYYTETSIMPVFHQMTVKISVTENKE